MIYLITGQKHDACCTIFRQRQIREYSAIKGIGLMFVTNGRNVIKQSVKNRPNGLIKNKNRPFFLVTVLTF